MGKSTPKKDTKEYVLTDKEFNYLKILNYALATSVLKDKCISGFLYYVCFSRLSYPESVNLVFEVDLDAETGILKVQEIPTETIQEALDK